jgi:hypothetical protein
MVNRITLEVHQVLQALAIGKSDSTVLAFVPRYPEQEFNLRFLGSVWARLRYSDLKTAYEDNTRTFTDTQSAVEYLDSAETKSDFFGDLILSVCDPKLEKIAEIMFGRHHFELAIARRRVLEMSVEKWTANITSLLRPDTIEKILWVDQIWFQYHAEQNVDEAVRLSDGLRVHIAEVFADVAKAKESTRQVVKGFAKARKAPFN